VFAVGLLSSVAGGARAALVRLTVSEAGYVPARSLLRVSAQLAQVGGNALGGILLVVLRPSGVLLLNAVSFAVAAIVLPCAVADYPRGGEISEASLVRDSLRGARAVFAKADLRRLILLSCLAPMF